MWTYVYTDHNNDFLAHAGRRGMKWGKHIFGNAAEEMRNAIAKAKASASAQTNVTSSGRKRNVSGEATGSLERREAVSGGPVNPNGAYSNRTPEQKEAFNKWNNRSDVVKKQAEIEKQMRKEAVTRNRLNLHSRARVVRHSAVWTYRYTDYNNDYEDFLMHHGILGQKWGVRRYQNKDGSLTAAGRARYLSDNTNQSIAKDRKFMKNDQDYDEETYQKVSSMHEARLNYKQNKTKENKIAYKKAKNDAWSALQLESGKQLYNKGETQASIFMKTAGKTLLKSLGAVAASAAIGFGIGAVASTLGMSVQTAQGVAVLASLPISVIAGVSVRKDEVRGYRQRKALDQYTRKINGG